MDIALKQRLIGASVLIALAVVILPMILGGRPDGNISETQRIEVPKQPPELDFETRKYPIGDGPTAPEDKTSPVSARPLPTPGNSSKGQKAVEASEDPVTVQQPVEKPLVAEPSPDSAPPSLPQTAATGRYLVQVASFGSIDNATRLANTLREQGHSVLLDSVKSDVGTLHRVRIGPFTTESAANDAVSTVRSQIGDVKPRVMDLQPDQTAQVTAPSDPLVRWVVQVGSFSSKSNADKLVARLRQDSLSAYSEEIMSSGSVIYRVRIGPYLQRDEAIRVDQLVNERLSLDGVVMSTD